MSHEPLCPANQWTKWWQGLFSVQDCRCDLIRRAKAEERARLIPAVLALPHDGRTEGAEIIWREDVLDLLGYEDDEDEEDG